MAQPISDLALETVRKAVEAKFDGNVARAAEAWGVKNDNLHKWLRGDRSPKLELIGPVLDKLGVSLTLPGKETEDYELVPRVKARAGAGESFETSDEVAGWYAFRKDFFRRISANPKKCVTMFVEGESMEPLIHRGDIILVDQTEADAIDGLVYLVNLSGALMVKRLFRLPQGWRLHSDNESHGNIDVLGDELSAFKIFGRVRWFGRVL